MTREGSKSDSNFACTQRGRTRQIVMAPKLLLVGLCAATMGLRAQSDERPSFEVVSVKLYGGVNRIYMGEPKGGIDYNGTPLASNIPGRMGSSRCSSTGRDGSGLSGMMSCQNAGGYQAWADAIDAAAAA